jgi:large subunit ribosomal protein L29
VMAKPEELHKKSRTELNKILKEKREQLGKSRFELVSGKLKNYRSIREVKKDIARILSLLREHTN